LVKFVDALTGTTKALEDGSQSIRASLTAVEHSRSVSDAARVTVAELTHDPVVALRAKHDSELQKLDSDIAIGRARENEEFKKDPTSAALHAATAATGAAIRAKRDALERQGIEMDQTEAQVRMRTQASATTTTSSRDLQTAANEQTAGNPINAAMLHNKAEVDALIQSYDEKMLNQPPARQRELAAEKAASLAAMSARQGLSLAHLQRSLGLTVSGLSAESSELTSRLSGDPDAAARTALRERQNRRYQQLLGTDAAGAAAYQSDVMPKEREELEKEINARRAKDAADTEAKIVSVEKQADEKMMQARGATYAASIAASKRETEERAADLRRQADYEDAFDKKKADALRQQAAAVERAGAVTVDAIQQGALRHARLANQAAGDELAVAGMEVAGQDRGAARTAAQRAYQRRRQQILDERNDPQVEAQKLQALDRQFMADRARRNYGFNREDAGFADETHDAEARARGQSGVGSVLGMAEHFRDLERSARGDRVRTRNVQAYERATIAAARRELMPPPGIYGLEQYHDAIQQGIGHGMAHTEALGLLGQLAGGVGKGAGGGNAALPDMLKGLGDAASDLKDAAKVIKNAKQIAILPNR
jgi:hypothetical protein